MNPTPTPPVEFEAPPVVEVVCGVVYAPLLLTAPHLGLLWLRYADDLPTTADKPPLIPGVQDGASELTVRLPELPRVWFVSADERRIVQFQVDRLHFNWRKQADGDRYPRFGRVFDEFARHLGTLDGFLRDAEHPVTRPSQYELTYVNRVPLGPSFTGLDKLGRVLPDFAWRESERYLVAPDSFRATLSFVLPESLGRLLLNVRTVRRKTEGDIELAMDLTARGAAGLIPMDEWFDRAHSAIVHAFTDLTGADMHREWGRKEGA